MVGMKFGVGVRRGLVAGFCKMHTLGIIVDYKKRIDCKGFKNDEDR